VIKSIRNDDEAYGGLLAVAIPEVASTTSAGLMYHLAAPSTIAFLSVFLALHELSALPPFSQVGHLDRTHILAATAIATLMSTPRSVNCLSHAWRGSLPSCSSCGGCLGGMVVEV
jgi:hypothetical protein